MWKLNTILHATKGCRAPLRLQNQPYRELEKINIATKNITPYTSIAR
ncbi:hypothetical protein ACEUAI_20425 [Aeromonas veronii]